MVTDFSKLIYYFNKYLNRDLYPKASMVFGKKPNTEGTLKKKRSMRILFQKQFLLILAQGVNISSLSKPYATIVTDSSAKLASTFL